MKQLKIILLACILFLLVGCQNKNTAIEEAKEKLNDYCRKLPTSMYTSNEDIYLFDVTGDGTINLGDVSKLYNYHKRKITMDNYQIEAGKVTNNSSVTLGDVSKLYNYYKGRISNLD